MRTHLWLRERAERTGGDLTVLFDYPADHLLLRALLGKVPKALPPVAFQAQNIGELTSMPEADAAAHAAWQDLAARGLKRHHALADAQALRQAFSVVRSVYLRAGGPAKC